MNIDRFKHQHHQILSHVAALRELSRAGVTGNAAAIAQRIVAMSAVIKLHLAAEDSALYPALQAAGDHQLARLGQRFQDEMTAIAAAYDVFARRWNTAAAVQEDAQGFRSDANLVLRRVHERMRHEDRDFYPAIEAADGVARAARQDVSAIAWGA